LDLAGFATGLRLAHDLYALVNRNGLASLQTAPRLETLAPVVVVQAITMWMVFFFSRLYHQPHGASRLDLTVRIFQAVSFGVILTYAFTSFIFPNLAYSRSIPIYDWGTTFACVLLLRLAHRAAGLRDRRRRRRYPGPDTRARRGDRRRHRQPQEPGRAPAGG
jgi:FlaA1/EpsC-like NDP-sugar epimerase